MRTLYEVVQAAGLLDDPPPTRTTMPDHTAQSAALYLTERGYLADGGGRKPGKHPPSADTVRRMVYSGRLPARRVGYIWLISQTTLDELIAAQQDI